jgi:CubicO group peptidase (beta-lactamase class C family)
VTFRDLLSHRSGPAEKDELWTSGEYSTRDILGRLDEMDVAAPLREHYEYSDVLYIASAELVESFSGTPWTDFDSPPPSPGTARRTASVRCGLENDAA